MRLASLLFILLFAFTVQVEAFSDDDLMRAKSDFATEDYASAIVHLERVLKQNPDDVDAIALLERSYAGMHMWEEGLAMVERLIAIQPDNVPAQIDKGEFLIGLNRHKEAIELFDSLLTKTQAPQLTQEIRNKRQYAINDQERHSFNGLLLTTVTWDSNTTLGQNSIVSTPTFLPISPSSQADTIYAEAIMLSHNYNTYYQGLSWFNQGIVYNTDNTTVKTNRVFLLVGSTGLKHTGRTYTNSLTYSIQSIYVQSDAFQLNHGFTYKLDRMLTKTSTISLSPGFVYRHHYNTTNTSGQVVTCDLTYSTVLPSKSIVALSTGYRFDQTPISAPGKDLKYKRISFRADYSRQYTQDITLKAGVSYRHDWYTGTDPIFTSTERVDNQFMGLIGADVMINENTRITSSITHSRNHANVPTRAFNQTQAILGAMYTF